MWIWSFTSKSQDQSGLKALRHIKKTNETKTPTQAFKNCNIRELSSYKPNPLLSIYHKPVSASVTSIFLHLSLKSWVYKSNPRRWPKLCHSSINAHSPSRRSWTYLYSSSSFEFFLGWYFFERFLKLKIQIYKIIFLNILWSLRMIFSCTHILWGYNFYLQWADTFPEAWL